MNTPPLPLSLSTASFYRFGFRTSPLEPIFAFAKTAGFDGIALDETITTRWIGADKFLALSRHYDLPITSLHQSFGRMFWTSLWGMDHIVRRAALMQAECAVVHVASVHRAFSNHDYWKKVKALEAKYGVPIAFENAMAQFSSLKFKSFEYAHDPDQLWAGAEENDLSLTYDVGHMGSLMPDPTVYYEKIKRRLKHIHLHDYRRGIDHLPLGTGEFPLPRFLRRLVEDRYAGVITLEVFPMNTAPWISHTSIQELVKESLQFFRTHTSV